MNFRNFCLLLLTLAACRNKIETGDTLTDRDKNFIQSIGLLDKDEKIYRFYSEYKKGVTGNFYTDKRLARYWIDEHDSSKSSKDFAFYSDIAALDTVYFAGLTYAPYILVIRKDSSQFKVAVDGRRAEIKAFFEEAIKIWEQKR